MNRLLVSGYSDCFWWDVLPIHQTHTSTWTNNDTPIALFVVLLPPNWCPHTTKNQLIGGWIFRSVLIASQLNTRIKDNKNNGRWSLIGCNLWWNTTNVDGFCKSLEGVSLLVTLGWSENNGECNFWAGHSLLRKPYKFKSYDIEIRGVRGLEATSQMVQVESIPCNYWVNEKFF